MDTTRFIVLVLALALAPLTALSATTTINATKDNTIYQSNSTFSAGGAAGLYTGATGQGSLRRSLLEFDIAGNVPSGSTITSAQLTLYLGSAPSSNSVSIELHKLTKDWGEGSAGSSTLSVSGSGMGFPANAGDATWSDAKLSFVTWTNPGASGDFNAVASAATAVNGPVDTPYTWASTAGLVADAQSWLDNPGTNFGWALINANEGTSGSVKAFYSRSATQNSTNAPNSLDLSWRPAVTITYVPEPATGWLLLVAGPVVWSLRRR